MFNHIKNFAIVIVFISITTVAGIAYFNIALAVAPTTDTTILTACTIFVTVLFGLTVGNLLFTKLNKMSEV